VDSLRACSPRRIVGLRAVLLMVAVTVAGGLALAFGLPGAGAKAYSAYDDPQKPVLSFLLSDDRNVEEFQREFGLSDRRVTDILAVVREEDSAFSREYDESERVVQANKGASRTEIGNKIAASDFDEKTKQAVARTKSKVENLLPKGRADDLDAWVDEQWQAETAEYAAASEATYRVSSRGFSCGLWMSYYRGNTRYEVALPHKKVKFSGGHRVRITDVRKGTSARAPVKETGPWNTRDDYWRARPDRSMWKDLPRCRPQAEAAFFDNYNRGKDQFGREVGNPAGIDITPAVARRMNVWRKIQRLGLIRVRVHFPWVRG
jgi:hypothetical protein